MNNGVCGKAAQTALFGVVVLAVAFVSGISGCDLHGKYVSRSSCMSPTINPGQIMITKRFHHGRDRLRRYDIIVFESPIDAQSKWVMRVAGLPGERVAVNTNALFINGIEVPKSEMPSVLRQEVWLPPQLLDSDAPRQWNLNDDEVFVVGDNLDNSNDSRFWGPLKLSRIAGVVEKVRARGALRIVVP